MIPPLQLGRLSAPTTPGFADLVAATPTEEKVARMTTDEFRQCKKLFSHLAAKLKLWRTRAQNKKNCDAFRKRQREMKTLRQNETDALRQELADAKAQIDLLCAALAMAQQEQANDKAEIDRLRFELAIAQLDIADLRGELRLV